MELAIQPVVYPRCERSTAAPALCVVHIRHRACFCRHTGFEPWRGGQDGCMVNRLLQGHVVGHPSRQSALRARGVAAGTKAIYKGCHIGAGLQEHIGFDCGYVSSTEAHFRIQRNIAIGMENIPYKLQLESMHAWSMACKWQ